MTGLTAHTLRYYEKAGLIAGISRSSGGYRQYSDSDLEWLELVRCLKNTGMPLSEIARFVQLAHEGDSTLRDRVELLHAHRETVIRRMAEMQQHLDKVTCKLGIFTEKLRAYEAGSDTK
ncbi:MAG: MerR family transcriptional regulator [Clostridia bacterium]|nr:MerR family transcriptional regulator [Clostridia bacterium]